VENQGIPINLSDLPTEAVIIPDDRMYKVQLEKVTLAMKVDKNDHMYVAVRCTVVEDEDYEGLPVERNYLALPLGVAADAPRKVKFAVQNHNAPFGRFVKAFKITGELPPILDVRDAEARQAVTDFFEKFYGNIGTVSVETREFPVGSGRMTTNIRDFVA
jgi:hypothetical protein